MDWKKIKETLTLFSQKSAQVARESVEKLGEKATVFSILNKAKMEVKAAEHRLEEAMEELGGEFYELYIQQETEDVPKRLNPQFERIRKLREELEAKRKELEELLKKYRPEPIEKDKIKALKRDLEEGGGTIEQIRIDERSPVAGKKLKSVKLPKEVLVGTVLRGEEVIIPDGTFSFRAGDYVTLLGKKDDVRQAVAVLSGRQQQEPEEGPAQEQGA